MIFGYGPLLFLFILITLSLIFAAYNFFRLEKTIRGKYPKIMIKGKKSAAKKINLNVGELITLRPRKEIYPLVYEPVNNKDIEKLRTAFKVSWFIYALSFYLFLAYLIYINVYV